jgi:hypothetical protein
MPYVRRASTTFVEICSDIYTDMHITNAAVTWTLNPISIPSTLKGAITRATLALVVHSFYDTSGATNYLFTPQHINLVDDTSTRRHAVELGQGCLRLPGNSFQTGGVEYPGNYDLTQYVKAGSAYDIEWTDARALGSNLELASFYTKLKIYLG